MTTYQPLTGELTPERLRQWAADHAGVPNVGPARALIRQHLNGHATLEQVLAAVAEFERLTEGRTRRHERQVWVGRDVELVDGRVYDGLRVWQPGRGEFTLSGVRFVAKAPRGAAAYHVMRREGGSDYSGKVGSFVEA